MPRSISLLALLALLTPPTWLGSGPLALAGPALAGPALAGPALGAPLAPQDLESLRDSLLSSGDEATEEMVSALAEFGTREALDSLLAAYSKMGSIYAKLLVVRVLDVFDGGEAAQSALQQLVDVATQSRDKELRDAAVATLGRCRTLGDTFLVLIVESDAMVEVREQALQAHIAMGKDSLAWYKKLYMQRPSAPEKKDKKSRKKGSKEEEEKHVRVMNSIRKMAFEAIQESLSAEELLSAAEEDPVEPIKMLALAELHDRKDKNAEKIARDLIGSVNYTAEMRALAADILADIDGEKASKEFIDLASKFPTPDVLRNHMADLLIGFGSEKVNKQLEKEIAKSGKPYFKRFVMRASSKLESKKINDAFVKALKDKEFDVRRLAVEYIGERKMTEALPDLRALVAKGRDPELLVTIIASLSKILGDNKEWQTELEGYVASSDRDVRNAALANLDGEYFDLLVKELENPDWSTRLIALQSLERMHERRVVGPIIARMEQEVGRMQHEFGDVLWRLTGQPFRTRQPSWKAWWAKEGETFALVSPGDLTKLAKEEEERRLKQVSSVKSEFFGVRIISKRVIFVLDVSGSMNWELGGENAAYGDPIRMEVATRELSKVLDNLEEDTLFNMIIFSSDVSAWLDDGIAGSTAHTREEAIEYVHRLGAGGGTNIYGALGAAFADQDVDTIVFLSDGEPSVGEVTDPATIREAVNSWNKTRHIKIHTIAVGDNLELLEWLSHDSGGEHVTYR